MKKSIPFSLAVFILTAFISCTKKSDFEKLDDGVIVHLKDNAGQPAKIVKVQVISDNIIHIFASVADSVSTEKSLAVLPPKSSNPSGWRVEENEHEISVLTSSLRVKVSLASGEVSFTDTTGNVILQEQKGGRYFTETTIDSLKGYQIRQVFESPADEAFYGLGGHQNGQVDYKGQDVELAQHNIVDVIPFLYSSKNYGILWDNYSISKFGDPRDYKPLNSLTLFSKDGKSGGLTTEYFVNNDVVKSTIEDKIDYEYLETPQVDSFPKDVAQKGKVVWEGSFTSEAEGDHKFLVYASGYFKVWVDNKLIMDKWRQGWNPWSNKFNVNIAKGEKHALKIEWTPDGGAYLAVKHLDPYPKTEQDRLSISSEFANAIDYYFIKGNNADEVISGYRQLTGKATLMPKWAMGFWQSRERYHTQKELTDVVKEYRKRKIPLDNIVLDWRYWEDPKWGSHEFDLTRFPDPKGMINELHNTLHANLMISVWPKFNKGTAHYDEMKSHGYLFMNNIVKKRIDWVGPGYENTFYNPFISDAGKLFWKQIDAKLNVLGVDAWWLDATEPDMHSNLSIEDRKANMSTNGKSLGTKYFNAYSLLNSKSVYEGQRASSPDKRVFILTRSAFAGQQRYGAATWSGDIVSRWSDLKDQIATGINFSISGIPYWTTDIGGFAVERRYEHATGETLQEWRELNTRWFQFGTFCPLFRSHGQFPYREIFNLATEGTETYSTLVYYDKLRYRLMPYIYSLAGQSFFNDYTIMRGLVMDFNGDTKTHTIADQYMFGPSLMINPVVEFKAESRKVYLPASTGWYDFYTGKFFEGGNTIQATAPLSRIPVFVREGSIIPAGPEVQYTAEKPADPITLYVFTGRNAHFELYEDEGVNYNYEKGQYTTINFDYDESTKTLRIGERKGSFKGMLESRTFQIVWVDANHATGVSLTTELGQSIKYTGTALQVKNQ